MPQPPRKKVAPEDAKAFQPSSFASRKAEAEVNNAKLAERRLVSLGPSDYPQRNLRTGEIEYSRLKSSLTWTIPPTAGSSFRIGRVWPRCRTIRAARMRLFGQPSSVRLDDRR